MKDRNTLRVKVNFYKTVRKKLPQISTKVVKQIITKEIKKTRIKEINIIVVGRTLIRNINKRFLKKDKITDVISFNLDETGEIYICRYFIRSEKDFIKLIFHGFSHIMGYDHVEKKQSKVMKIYEKKLIVNYFKGK